MHARGLSPKRRDTEPQIILEPVKYETFRKALEELGKDRDENIGCRDARRPRHVVQESLITFLHEAFLPAPDTGLRLAGAASD